MANRDASRQPGAVRYMPALDGVRGISMLAVLIGHLTIFGGTGLLFQPRLVSMLGGGELCLEVFFVLSGALITHLALSEISRTGTIDLRRFRNRRVRRLAPAAALILIATITLCVAGLRDDTVPLGVNPTLVVLSVLALSSNWLLFTRANLGYLTPTWSLSVEEQFYLAWPLTLRRTWNRLGPAGAALAALALLVAGLGASVALVSHEVYATYATPVAGVGLLCGCLVAIALHSQWAPSLRRILGSTPLAVALAVCIGFSARWLHFHIHAALRGGYLGFDVATALLIGHLMVRSTRPSALSRLLGIRPLAYLGRISYGAYLFHATIYQMWDRSGLLPNVTVRGVVDVATALTVASISYRYFEEPIRLGRLRLPRRRRVAPVSARAVGWARLRFVPQLALGVTAVVVVLQFAPAFHPLPPQRSHPVHVAAAGQVGASLSARLEPKAAGSAGTRHQPEVKAARHEVPTRDPVVTPTAAAANVVSSAAMAAKKAHAPGVVASPVVTRAGRRWLAVFRPAALGASGQSEQSGRMTVYQWQRNRWAVIGMVAGIPAAAAGTTYRIGVTTLSGTTDPAWVIRATYDGVTAIGVVSDIGGRWHLVGVKISSTDRLLHKVSGLTRQQP